MAVIEDCVNSSPWPHSLLLFLSLSLSLSPHRKTVVIGSGYIAVELAGILNALGSDVTLVVRYDRVLRSFDRMLADSLMGELAAAGVKVVRFSKVSMYMCKYACLYMTLHV